VIEKLRNKEKRLTFISDLLLLLAMFFLPFGFDFVQYFLISLVGSILGANLILYFISGLFFTGYFLLRKYKNK